VERFPRLVPVTALGLVFVLIGSFPTVLRKDRSSADIAAVLLDAQRNGLEVCSLGYSGEPLLAYVETVPLASAGRVRECDVVVALPAFSATVRRVNLGSLVEVEDPMGLSMMISWTETAGRSSPALASIMTSGETSASGIDS
jgi:hypothetical protein